MTNRSDRYAMKGARAILRARLRRGPVPCWYCGVLVTLEDDWHTAHAVPFRDGGRATYDNVVVAHARCNLSDNGSAGAATTNARRGGYTSPWS
ncbi:HNH endonuclease [Cellulosimicrobium sp. 22601]|uniref:HNH endonuclease n=1 Tax=unclassified Cellulosimicrobium TaxID=2624466 RepID=UPI003F83EF6B